MPGAPLSGGPWETQDHAALVLPLLSTTACSVAQFPGCGRVELGATWLHGLAGNPLYDYAVEQGLMSAKADQKGRLLHCARSRFYSTTRARRGAIERAWLGLSGQGHSMRMLYKSLGVCFLTPPTERCPVQRPR